MEVPVLEEKVRVVMVEAGISCGGPVGTFKGKICVKERQACSIGTHETPVKDFVSGYYLQPANNTTTVYSTPFIPTSVGENNQVLLAQLDRELLKTTAMAIAQEILALEEPDNPFDLKKEELMMALNATTTQQGLVADLSLRGPPSSVKKMWMKEPIDPINFQDEAVSLFAEGVQHNFQEAKEVLMTLQSDQKITDVAVGATPDGYSTVWSTLGGVCDMVDQHDTLLGGLPAHAPRMLEVDRLLGEVQSSGLQQYGTRPWLWGWQLTI